MIITLQFSAARARMTPCRSQEPNDKGAAPRFAMASPSIWCRITLQAAIFSPPLCLSRSLPSYVLSFPTLEIGMMLFLIKTLTHRPTLSSASYGLVRSKGTLDDPIFARIHVPAVTYINTLLEKKIIQLIGLKSRVYNQQLNISN